MSEQINDDMSYLQSPIEGNEEPTDPNSMLNYILGFPEKGTPTNDSPQISLGFGNLNNEASPLTRCFSRLEPGSNEEPPPQSLYTAGDYPSNSDLGNVPSLSDTEPIGLFGIFKPLSNTNSPMYNPAIPPETLFNLASQYSLSNPTNSSSSTANNNNNNNNNNNIDASSEISQRQQQSINYFTSLTSATQPSNQNSNHISSFTQHSPNQQPLPSSSSFQSIIISNPSTPPLPQPEQSSSSSSSIFNQTLLNISISNNNNNNNISNDNNKMSILLDDETKRKKRLERNRESARQSRSKKKEHSIELDEKLHNLIVKLCEVREEYMMKLRKEKIKNLEKELEIISQYILLNKNEELSISMKEFLNNYGTSNNDDYLIIIETINHLIESLLPVYSQFEYWLCSNEMSEFENGENFAVGTLGGDVGIRFTNRLQSVSKNNNNLNNNNNNEFNNNNNNSKYKNIWCKLVSNLSLTAEQEMKLRLDLTSQKNNNNDKRLMLMKIINILKELRNGITNLHNSMKLINNKIYSILTDEQLFEYHKWLDLHKEELNNYQFMNSLNSLNLK